VIAASCRNLQGLDLLNISAVENHVLLWKILADMRLIYLAIELYVFLFLGKVMDKLYQKLFPHFKNAQF